MFERYQNFVAPIEVKDDPEQTRVSALLNRLLLMFIYILIPFLVIGPFIFPVWYASWAAFVCLVALWFLARYLTRKGYLRYFSMGFVLVLWMLTTWLVYLAGGLERTPNAFSYVTVVAVAGMLLGGRGGVIATIMSVASLSLLLYLKAAGLLPPQVEDGTELDEVFIISSNLAVVALFQLMAWHSQRDALQKERALAKKALAASQYKTDLMARVSHELRTPLGAVLGLADMLRSGAAGEIRDEQESILQKVVYNAEYLQSMVDDLLEQSHLHSGKLIFKQEAFPPADLLDRVVATHEVVAKGKGLHLQLKGAERLPEVLTGDPARLMEIFSNLLSNALKYTEQGEVEISSCMLDNGHWQVAIRDTGVGVAPELLDSIFEPFMQVCEPVITRKQGGVGLGLAITKQLVEMMGGTIAVASEVGVGSAFTVTLPAIGKQEERK
jgi:signal transduction histidine kinase